MTFKPKRAEGLVAPGTFIEGDIEADFVLVDLRFATIFDRSLNEDLHTGLTFKGSAIDGILFALGPDGEVPPELQDATTHVDVSESSALRTEWSETSKPCEQMDTATMSAECPDGTLVDRKHLSSEGQRRLYENMGCTVSTDLIATCRP